ncbi:imidazolonepropionase [Pontixanthobacter aestiaquae]|uniref:Imidazolonepropionase n=1 Tax=Pontixanthobacter aestiaquae TaxID=1509367 RepID=A0A844Z6H6_9SPHN|nr:imidazolonepropionase [Pontixanthobacter aestiaquae]MDN3646595.1 imidazolonepropionase [Pontixanthobacter aestiaquae]MXO82420.1 imidazolonepropionase [Pontixanthobacter aestiaquae]
MQHKILLTGCRLATMAEGGEPYGLIKDGAVAIEAGRITWVGPRDDLPEEYSAYEVEDLEGRLVTPALIDCHTHLLFGGNRAREFEMRLNGASYEEIARSGGGIVSTVNATRAASDAVLIAGALKRLDHLIAEGVAVVEIKSGYGLTIKQEMRMLRLARQLETLRPVKIVTTWLAAHALPAEYEDRADSYIDEIAIAGMRHAAAEGLVDAVDGFCESIGFSPEQIARVFDAAKELGLPVKLHAEQLSDLKGALLVGEYGGLSADHLEYLAESDVPAFAQSGVIAVILPGAFYTLRETKLPPIEALRENNVPMAIATDCNPGSSPLSSILTAMNMASTQFAMTPEEVLAGVTRNAAQALGLAGDYGTLSAGVRAELAVWDADHPSELSYWIGGSPLFKRISAEPNR